MGYDPNRITPSDQRALDRVLKGKMPKVGDRFEYFGDVLTVLKVRKAEIVTGRIVADAFGKERAIDMKSYRLMDLIHMRPI